MHVGGVFLSAFDKFYIFVLFYIDCFICLFGFNGWGLVRGLALVCV